jgi:DNA-binding NtrC family response regulator
MRKGSERSQPLLGARVLIAEDEVFIALDLEAVFEDAGASVVGPCLTLKEALQCASNEMFQAAILDLRLGHDSTEPVALTLLDRGIPFLFYSGQTIPQGLKAAAPHCRLIEKPAPLDDLVRAVQELIVAPS